MPNWCSNTLIITGPAESIAAIKVQLAKADPTEAPSTITTPHGTSSPLSANTYTPDLKLINIVKPWGTPEEELDYHSEGDAWYPLNIKYWGTKWDVDGELDEEKSTPESLTYEFTSAWSPPEAAIAKCAENWPELSFLFTFDEAGSDYAGLREYRNGGNTQTLDSPSRQHFCHLCENYTYCAWGEEILCGYSLIDPANEAYPTLLHVIYDRKHSQEVVASLIRETIEENFFGGVHYEQAQEKLAEIIQEAGAYTTAEELADLTALLGDRIPVWIAQALTSSLNNEEKEKALEHETLELRNLAHLGIIAGALIHKEA